MRRPVGARVGACQGASDSGNRTQQCDGRHAKERRTTGESTDSDALVAHIESLEGRVVIPSRSNRRHPRTLDKAAYRQRNVIERWFGRMKVFRRVATRYEKTALSYLGAVAAAAWLVALTGWRG